RGRGRLGAQLLESHVEIGELPALERLARPRESSREGGGERHAPFHNLLPLIVRKLGLDDGAEANEIRAQLGGPIRVRVHQPHDLAGRSDAGTGWMAVAIALMEDILRQHSVDPSFAVLRGVRHWLHVFYRPKVLPTRGLGSVPTYAKRARPMPMAEPCT